MARTKKSPDPLRKQEVEIIQARHTEKVLRAVLRYSEKDVATAVSFARRYLRDEMPEEDMSEMDELLARDNDLDIPDTVLAQNKDARFGNIPTSASLLDSDSLVDDSFLSDPTPVAKPERSVRREEPQEAPDEPQRRKRSLPSSTPKAAPQRRRETIPDPEPEPTVEAIPVAEEEFDFLDEPNNEPSGASLLVPESLSDVWDDTPEEEEETFIPKRREPKSTFTAQEDDSDDDIVDLADMWSLSGESKKEPRKHSQSLGGLLDDLGIE